MDDDVQVIAKARAIIECSRCGVGASGAFALMRVGDTVQFGVVNFTLLNGDNAHLFRTGEMVLCKSCETGAIPTEEKPRILTETEV